MKPLNIIIFDSSLIIILILIFYFNVFEYKTVVYFLPVLPFLYSISSIYWFFYIRNQNKENKLKSQSSERITILILTIFVNLIAISSVILYVLLVSLADHLS